MKRILKHSNKIELGILLLALICCFIPCLQYNNNLIIDIYVFDANKIMGYSYMVLLIVSIILLIIKRTKNIKYLALTTMIISGTLYIVSSLLRKNMFIHLSYGFYIVVFCIFLMIVLNIIKAIVLKRKNKK